MAVARRVTVKGRVQGVFFRAWTQQQAQQVGVYGWVRNCPDGSVEAHLEGSESGVAHIVEKMRKGPSDANVDEVDVRDVQFDGFSRFEVRH
jgi:acylphosphatase